MEDREAVTANSAQLHVRVDQLTALLAEAITIDTPPLLHVRNKKMSGVGLVQRPRSPAARKALRWPRDLDRGRVHRLVSQLGLHCHFAEVS